MLDCKRYLTHATVRTCLQTHLLRTHLLSPPLSFLPHIHAAQEPPEDQWSDVKGEDSLELHTIPKDKCKGKHKCTPFPYCLKCSDEEPNHAEGDCPLWKYCRWYFHIDHTYDDCPTPIFNVSRTLVLCPSGIQWWAMHAPLLLRTTCMS